MSEKVPSVKLEGDLHVNQATGNGKLSCCHKMAYAFPRGATTGMGLQLQQTVRYYYIEALGGACRSCDDLELPRGGALRPPAPDKGEAAAAAADGGG